MFDRDLTALSDLELLATVISSGVDMRPMMGVAAAALAIIDRTYPALPLDRLATAGGLGRAKAAALGAALEFSRRRIRPHGIRIRSASDIYPLVRHHATRKQELFLVVTLNGAHELIATRVITVGTLSQAPIHPREVFADAITDRAAAIVLAHNHPSNDLTPSTHDIEATRRLVETGKLLGIPVLDHLIFGGFGFRSLAELGELG